MHGDSALQAAGDWTSAIDALRDGAPVAIAVVVLAVVVVLVVVGWLVRVRRRRHGSPATAFRAALADEDEIAVLLHPNPDPDAMACGAATKHLAESVATRATLQYPGEIRHQENRAFRTVLDLDLDRIESAADLAADAVVLVDHNRPRGLDGGEEIEPYAVIDHHPGDGVGEAFTDVRPEDGSCASILSEYFEDLNATRYGPEESEPAGSKDLTLPSGLATGLLYGILSDTDHLTKGCSPADYAASAYLFPTVDEDLLDRIATPQVDAEVLDVKARAIAERETQPPYAVSDVGSVDNLDAIPQAADELMFLEGITAVVVVGDKDGTLHLSGRSRDDRVHMGRVLETTVADIDGGDAGGHARMGGGQVALDGVNRLGASEASSWNAFRDRLFGAMAGDG